MVPLVELKVMAERTQSRTGEGRKWITRIIVSSGLSLLLIAVLVWLLFLDTRLTKGILDLKSHLDLRNQEVASLSRLKQERQRAEVLEQKLERIVPDTERLLSVNSDLDAIAGETGMQQSFAFGQETPATAQEPKAVAVNLSLVGTLSQFLSHLGRLEALPYVLNLNQIEILFITPNYQINASGKIYAR